MAANLNIDFLTKTYFYFDKPVKYKLCNNQYIEIFPILLTDSEIFLSSIDLFMIDKNSLPDPSIIQMSYLQFIVEKMFTNNQTNVQKFVNLVILCLHLQFPEIIKDERNKFKLVDKNGEIIINHTDFENIRRIILYQNFQEYDDSYINPDLKKAMNEVDMLRSKNIVPPSLERKIAIITSHTGISKEEQLKMTYRSHALLFNEVFGEIEFVTLRPIALFAGEGEKLEHWIYKPNKNKLDEYITSVDTYAQSMGSSSNKIKSTIKQN